MISVELASSYRDSHPFHALAIARSNQLVAGGVGAIPHRTIWSLCAMSSEFLAAMMGKETKSPGPLLMQI